MVTPIKKKDFKEASLDFVENERKFQTNSNGNSRYQPSKKNLSNPFKPQPSPAKYSKFIPAGYESELSDASDEFDFN